MANVAYPQWLPLPQRASQNMTQDTGFITTQPAVGPAIFTPITTDLKATWSLTWIFTLAQAEIFKSWLRSPNYCDRGRAWFTMPIDLGDTQGPQDQTLHFVSMPVQTSKDGNSVTWTASVISNGISDITEDYDDRIVETQPESGFWMDLLVSGILPYDQS
ncbi:hypothetical protein G3M83_09390 [Rouxiella badensis]|uniref:hypothetical protein n=1 Tax=Rouxiella badensis TaxID=1646377 RepID=UPI0013EF0920|nr:hypothetical protein [Rouxiella badensis]QII37895.1 hypothetical protein G3M83_09390 [Rouxiella badensis]